MNEKVWTRASNYRDIYFKYNKGIFYKWYLCAYCRKRYLEKDIVEVDHCIAVNAVKTRWYFQLLFTLMGTTVNDKLNLVASCRKCNRKKGKKVEGWVMRGAVGKVYHSILQTLSQNLIVFLAKYWYIALGIIFLVLFQFARNLFM